MQDKILDFLRKKQNYASGEEISERLGISRQALWKHIQELKEAGYEIVAVPHLGYQLVDLPDRLYPSELSHHLNTKVIGKKIYYFPELPSTNDKAAELGLIGAHDGTLVLTEFQSRGRGRLGRNWFSPRYKGIYISLILRPEILPNQAPILTLLTAVSICEAVKSLVGFTLQIKWPNDIMLGHKKLGGILTELNAEMDEVRFLVIGIGLNVNNDRKSLPIGATSLKEHKKDETNRIELLQEILRKIEANYLSFQEKGTHPIIQKWKEYNITLGRRVKIASHNRHVEGEAVNIDPDGSLIVRNDLGLSQKITAGDVVHCR